MEAHQSGSIPQIPICKIPRPFLVVRTSLRWKGFPLENIDGIRSSRPRNGGPMAVLRVVQVVHRRFPRVWIFQRMCSVFICAFGNVFSGSNPLEEGDPGFAMSTFPGPTHAPRKVQQKSQVCSVINFKLQVLGSANVFRALPSFELQGPN